MNPSDTNASVEPVTVARVPTVPRAMLYGSLSFGAVSVLAYSIWAFRLVPGAGGLYATTATVYIGLAGLALARLVIAPVAHKRFPALFAISFVAYAICWCAFWFALGHRYQGDFWGAAAGLAVMTWVLQRGLGYRRGFPELFLVLLAFHSAGYYAGEFFYSHIPKSAGRLLFGAAHGLGFGAGLGYVIARCQRFVAPLKPVA